MSSRQVYYELKQRGIPDPIAAGIMGNMAVESDGFKSDVNEYNPVVKGSRGGYGLNQWTGSRRRDLEQFAEARKMPISDIGLQVDFMMHELTTTERAAGKALLSARTPEEAARIYSNKYLRPGIPHLEKRLNHTSAIYGAMQNIRQQRESAPQVRTLPEPKLSIESIDAMTPATGESTVQTTPEQAKAELDRRSELKQAATEEWERRQSERQGVPESDKSPAEKHRVLKESESGTKWLYNRDGEVVIEAANGERYLTDPNGENVRKDDARVQELLAKPHNQDFNTRYGLSPMTGGISTGGGFLQSLAHKAPFNFGDEIAAGLAAAQAGTMAAFSPEDQQFKWSEAYGSAHDQLNNQQQQYDKEKPIESMSAGLLGALGTGSAVYKSMPAAYKGVKGLMGMGALEGAAFGAGDQSGKGRLANTVTGGAIGGAVGGVLGGLGKAAAPVLRSIRGNDGAIDRAIAQSGIKLDDLSPVQLKAVRDEVRQVVAKGGEINPSELQRLVDFKALDLPVTKGLISQNPQQWSREIELAKAGDAHLSPALDNLQRGLLDRVASNADGSLGNHGTAARMNDVFEDYLQKSNSRVGELYSRARNASDAQTPLDGARFANNAFKSLDDQALSYALPPGMEKKITDIANGNTELTVKTAEALRQNANGLFGNDKLANKSLSIIKDSIDNEIAKSAAGSEAGDLYKQALEAAKARFRTIDGIPGLKAADKGIEPDKFFDKYIMRGNIDEMRRMTDFIEKEAPEFMAYLKAQVLDEFQTAATKGFNPETQAFSSAGFGRAIDRFGRERLALLFNDAEIADLDRLRSVAEYSIKGARNTSVNHSNTAVNLMYKLASMKIPLVNMVADGMTNASAKREGANAIRNVLSYSPSSRVGIFKASGMPGGLLTTVSEQQRTTQR